MALYDPPSADGFEPRRMVFSTWTDLLPLGYDLVASANPRVLVELGVYNGTSYFAFCQAVREREMDTRCYGVDTWEGDDHTGGYRESVWDDVSGHNEAHYGDFSTLLRTTFEEAVGEFSDESIDFVHLDGLHTYDAVRRDFESWFPKLRPGGLFLFHDVRARLEGFGVWRFWDELTREHETFTFDHGFGLGVLRKSSGDRRDDGDLLRLMFGGDDDHLEALRTYYAWAAASADLERKARVRERVKASSRAAGRDAP